jgi:hypothetical protein
MIGAYIRIGKLYKEFKKKTRKQTTFWVKPFIANTFFK